MMSLLDSLVASCIQANLIATKQLALREASNDEEERRTLTGKLACKRRMMDSTPASMTKGGVLLLLRERLWATLTFAPPGFWRLGGPELAPKMHRTLN